MLKAEIRRTGFPAGQLMRVPRYPQSKPNMRPLVLGLLLTSLTLPAQTPPPLDLNTATAAQLTALPGMGPVYARRIIAGRPYTAKNQLVTRGILPQAAYEAIKDRIVAHRPRAAFAHSTATHRRVRISTPNDDSRLDHLRVRGSSIAVAAKES